MARKHQDLISSGSHQQTSHPSLSSSPPGHGSASSSSPPSPGALTTGDFSTIRHVPERPYKCQACPSSTFSTQSNLRKHLETKHGNGNMDEHDEEESKFTKLSIKIFIKQTLNRKRLYKKSLRLCLFKFQIQSECRKLCTIRPIVNTISR